MSPAGIEPATTCTHTDIATILESLLYQLSYGGTSSNPAGDTFWIVSCLQDACYPNCTRKYYTLKLVQGMYTVQTVQSIVFKLAIGKEGHLAGTASKVITTNMVSPYVH